MIDPAKIPLVATKYTRLTGKRLFHCSVGMAFIYTGAHINNGATTGESYVLEKPGTDYSIVHLLSNPEFKVVLPNWVTVSIIEVSESHL